MRKAAMGAVLALMPAVLRAPQVPITADIEAAVNRFYAGKLEETYERELPEIVKDLTFIVLESTYTPSRHIRGGFASHLSYTSGERDAGARKTKLVGSLAYDKTHQDDIRLRMRAESVIAGSVPYTVEISIVYQDTLPWVSGQPVNETRVRMTDGVREIVRCYEFDGEVFSPLAAQLLPDLK